MNTAKESIPIIIDIEASGFDPQSYPIEIGIVFETGIRYSTLIKPVEEWQHWDSTAEKLHHIQREVLLQRGKPVRDVALELNKLLDNKTIFSDGWVVDKPWLENLFYHAAIDRSFFISPIEMILNEQQMAYWHEVKNRVIVETNLQRHRASGDAWIIQQTYLRTLELQNTA